MSEAGVTPGDIGELIALVEQDKLTDAEYQARVLLARHPTTGMLWKILGVALLRQGKGALQALRRTVDLMPQDAEAHGNLGLALQERGQWAEALASWQRTLGIEPQNLEALIGAADALRALGRTGESVAFYRRALLRDANLGVAHSGLGHALRDLGQFREAASRYAQALELDPQSAENHYHLGNALFDLLRPQAAVDCYRQALALQPDHAAAHLASSAALRLLRRADEAQASCQAALAVEPNNVEALSFLGELHADQGRFADAHELFERAIGLDAGHPAAWCSIAAHRKMTPADDAWRRGAQALLGKRLSLRQEISVRYALGKYCDDLEQYAAAFEHYVRANELSRRQDASYDRAKLTRQVDRVIGCCDRRFIEAAARHACTSEVPVFIIGMPRSGTSLAEQIMASHPAIVGAGELSFWDAAFCRFTETRGKDAPPGGSPPAPLMAEVAGAYLARLPPAAGVLRVTDKMPANFLYAGLIHAIFPQARIIHMRRHPLDTCLSMYFQNFFGIGPYANDLGDLAHYYGEYARITDHWRALLPGASLLEVPYESLIADQETWSRRMIEFVGLPWDARCLDFHRTERVVITASKWQVRQKIHGASAGRWRHYEPWLGPLKQALKCAGVRV